MTVYHHHFWRAGSRPRAGLPHARSLWLNPGGVLLVVFWLGLTGARLGVCAEPVIIDDFTDGSPGMSLMAPGSVGPLLIFGVWPSGWDRQSVLSVTGTGGHNSVQFNGRLSYTQLASGEGLLMLKYTPAPGGMAIGSPTAIGLSVLGLVHDSPMTLDFRVVDTDGDSWTRTVHWPATTLVPEPDLELSSHELVPVGTPDWRKVAYIEYLFHMTSGADMYIRSVGIGTVTEGPVLTVSTVGQGSVTIDPAKEHYDLGETVQLAAVANEGWVFADWSGDAMGSAPTVSVTMDGSKAITARFQGRPVLASVGNQSIGTLQTLSLTFTATDPDTPVASLRYSILDGPEGATIHAETGAFQWTPREDQGPGTHPVTVVVTDSGTPPLSDSVTFTVQVHAGAEPIIIDDFTDGSPGMSLMAPGSVGPLLIFGVRPSGWDRQSVLSVTGTGVGNSVWFDDGLTYMQLASGEGLLMLKYTPGPGGMAIDSPTAIGLSVFGLVHDSLVILDFRVVDTDGDSWTRTVHWPATTLVSEPDLELPSHELVPVGTPDWIKVAYIEYLFHMTSGADMYIRSVGIGTLRPDVTLQIDRVGDRVRLSWPASAAGYALERSGSIQSSWSAAGLAVNVEDDQYVAYEKPGASPQLFRLSKQE